jgi:hypothetical protein
MGGRVCEGDVLRWEGGLRSREPGWGVAVTEQLDVRTLGTKLSTKMHQ